MCTTNDDLKGDVPDFCLLVFAHRTDPLTQIKLTNTMLFPNLGLRSAIEVWLTKHAEKISSMGKGTEPTPESVPL